MPRSRIAIAMLIAAAALTAVSACSSTPMPANIAGAPPIDLPRFMGRWHVIARVPYFAERGHVASVDEYTLQPDGDIGVRYTYRKRFSGPQQSLESRATVKARTGNRQWTTRFFRVIPTRYRILEVAPDYSWALIDYPGRDLAWVFARAGDGRCLVPGPGAAPRRIRRQRRQGAARAAGGGSGGEAGVRDAGAVMRFSHRK